MTIECRPIIRTDDIEAVVDLHGLIWVTDERDAIPSHILIALQHAGSLLLGAFDDDRVVGFSLAFPGYSGNEQFLWSHATGVLPEYQGRGIGQSLKLLQKQLAVEAGFSCIRWTYDPLQLGNANLNISHLGCRCNQYHMDFYGDVSDGLNAGLPTDRFEVRWPLSAEACVSVSALPEPQPILVVNSDDKPSDIKWSEATAPTVAVEIPGNINELRRNNLELARTWRALTRKVFTTLFVTGYDVVGFQRRVSAGVVHSGAYILAKQR